VVLGTAALRDPELAEAIAAAHGERVVVSVDARAGKVSAEGWTEDSELGPAAVIARLSERGIERFVHTPVAVDGLLEGPDSAGLADICAATSGEVIYSGGVGSVEDLGGLAALEIENLGGVIVGRALYEQRFTVTEGQAALGG
jgi:phosphoribosylformimino-5-aminoimidazole carboxamide ribonucleotide (ProFAR) isomerase